MTVKQQENSMTICGFQILFDLITSMSPQLGGKYRDLQQYVDTLVVSEGEPVLEFYLRALKMSQEIQTQKDKTGQNNRLTRRFVTLLFQIRSFTECTREVMTELTRLFRLPDNHFKELPYDLQMIYKNDIIDKCAPSMITQNAKYAPPNPQIASMNVLLIRNDTNLQKEEESEEEQLHNPIINAARMNHPNNNTSDKTPYNPTRCKHVEKHRKNVIRQ